jgi:hypothetical protein
MFSGHLSLLGAILQAAAAERAARACAPMGPSSDPTGDKFFTALALAVLVIMVICGTYSIYLAGGIWTLAKVVLGFGLFATLVWVIHSQLD